jgi:hypothetical protein
MVDLQTISFVVAGISVSIAAIYYLINIRINNRARQAAILSSLQSRIDTPEFWERYIDIVYIYRHMDYKEFSQKVLKDKRKSAEVMSVISTFYHIGWLVKKKLLDINAVIGFTFDIVIVYDAVMSHIAKFGEEQGQPYRPGHYPYFTYLYDEIKKYRESFKKEK